METGEIRLFAGAYAPAGWAWCDGALLKVADRKPLFDKIGTTWGGDGKTDFAVPDLRGRAAMHFSKDVAFASRGTVDVARGPSSLAGRVALNFIIALAEDDDPDPILGEVRLFPYSFVPDKYEPCDGRELPIRSYPVLFSILDKAFGGDGANSLALPDLRGAFPYQPSDPERRAERGGSRAVPGEAGTKPLFALRYCIAVEGRYPFRG